MKKFLFFALLVLGMATGLLSPLSCLAQAAPRPPRPAFTEKEKKAANTAASATYLSQKEKEVVMYLNLARMYPKKYREILLYGKDTLRLQRNPSYASLMRVLQEIEPRKPLKTNEQLWEGAKKQARVWANPAPGETAEEPEFVLMMGFGFEYDENETQPGKASAARPETQSYNMICDSGQYGVGNPAALVARLLLDEDDTKVTIRKRLLGQQFFGVGVALVPDAVYGTLYVVRLGGRQ